MTFSTSAASGEKKRLVYVPLFLLAATSDKLDRSGWLFLEPQALGLVVFIVTVASCRRLTK